MRLYLGGVLPSRFLYTHSVRGDLTEFPRLNYLIGGVFSCGYSKCRPSKIQAVAFTPFLLLFDTSLEIHPDTLAVPRVCKYAQETARLVSIPRDDHKDFSLQIDYLDGSWRPKYYRAGDDHDGIRFEIHGAAQIHPRSPSPSSPSLPVACLI